MQQRKDRRAAGRVRIHARVLHRHPLVALRAHDRRPDTGRGPRGGRHAFLRGALGPRDTARSPADVRPWKEDESPFELLARRLARSRARRSARRRGHDALFHRRARRRRPRPRSRHGSGRELVAPAAWSSQPAELALMQAANNVTHRGAAARARTRSEPACSATDILRLMIAATGQLGGSHEFSLVLLNEASAYPHGSHQAAAGARGLGDPHRHRLQRARLPVRYLAQLGVR